MRKIQAHIASNDRKALALNAICPYFTMFPIDFPLRILKRAESGHRVLDPFCGRGTTLFAARASGLSAVGIDSSPIAVAVAKAKLAHATGPAVVSAARRILRDRTASHRPRTHFWQRAFHHEALDQLCTLREALLEDCRSDVRVLLRALIMGALHGPRNKKDASYFSNQCPRTFAPKPKYSLKFWRDRELKPPAVNAIDIIGRRAKWYLGSVPRPQSGGAYHGDSREQAIVDTLPGKFDWVITSPPYYGMRTYVQDQWLRAWFLGGPAEVDYAPNEKELGHSSPEKFAEQLKQVWTNSLRRCRPSARLVCRFGSIRDRTAPPLDIIKESFRESGWRIVTIQDAGSASDGKRQADQFASGSQPPHAEYDVYAVIA